MAVCKGLIVWSTPEKTMEIPITAWYLDFKETSGLWKPSHLDNFVLTQYPFTQTQLQMTADDSKRYPEVVRLLSGFHICSCNGEHLPEYEEKEYWPFTVTVTNRLKIMLANSVNETGMILTDFIG